MKRYAVQMIGPSTNDRIETVESFSSKAVAGRIYDRLLVIFGNDHGVILRDTKTNTVLMKDLKGTTIDLLTGRKVKR